MLSTMDFQQFSDRNMGTILMGKTSGKQYSAAEILRIQNKLSGLKSKSSLLKNVELSDFSLNLINQLQ